MSKFTFVKNANCIEQQKINEILNDIKNQQVFGKQFTNYMAHIHYKNGEWINHEIIPFANISLSPAAAVFHYGQEIFEGIKAYKWDDNSIHSFRIKDNAKRFQLSAKRVVLPELPVDDFYDAIIELLKIEKDWVPKEENMSLYIRPFLIASEAFLGLKETNEADFYVILSPVAPYISGVATIWLEDTYFRAGPGGTGNAKCGGNYAASLLPKKLAKAQGCNECLFLDAKTNKYVEEFSGMSFFCVDKNNVLYTPKINDSILQSITRDSIIKIAKKLKINVQEKKLIWKNILEKIKKKEIVEIFSCGTAAVVSPVGVIKGKGFEVVIGDGKMGKISKLLKDELVGIQTGKKEDSFNWVDNI